MRPFLFLCALTLLAPSAGAQSWRTITATRPAAAGDSLRVDLDFTAGTVRLVPGAPDAALYDLSLRYDAEKYDPTEGYDRDSHTLSATIRSRSGRERGLRSLAGGIGGNSDHPNELTLTLAPGVPLDLALSFAAADATVELGGLSVSRLAIHAAATRTSVSFSALNPIPMELLDIEAAAASVEAKQLANAHAAHIRAHAAAGGLELDFGGSWTSDIALSVTAAVGGVTLRIPRDVGVHLHLSKVAGGFDAQGLVKHGDDEYSSPGWEQAQHKLTIDADATLGGLTIDWMDPRPSDAAQTPP